MSLFIPVTLLSIINKKNHKLQIKYFVYSNNLSHSKFTKQEVQVKETP
jgi:hypothetical protein